MTEEEIETMWDEAAQWFADNLPEASKRCPWCELVGNCSGGPTDSERFWFLNDTPWQSKDMPESLNARLMTWVNAYVNKCGFNERRERKAKP